MEYYMIQPTTENTNKPFLYVEVESELAELLPNFIKKRRQDLITLKEKVAQSEFTEIKKMGHDLRGVTGAFGYYFLTEIGKEIEVAALAKDTTKLNQLVQQYETLMQNYKIKIEGDNKIYEEIDFL